VIPNDNPWEKIGILLGVNDDPSGNQTLLAGNSRTTGMFTTGKSLNCWGILQLLVGGFNPSEKYESDWIIIPAIGEVIKVMFQTTNQIYNQHIPIVGLYHL